MVEAKLQAVVFGFVEGGEVRVFDDEGHATREWAQYSRDVESEVVVFYDSDGKWLKPVMSTSLSGAKQFDLVRGESPGDGIDPICLAVREASSLAPNMYFASLSELRSRFPMQTSASSRLLSIALPPNASAAERGDAVQLHVRQDSIEVVVTVPKSVHEWFVEATDASTGTRVEDWSDYDGYDSSSAETLDAEMAEDVSRFVKRLLAGELRLEAGHRAKLLWKTAGAWQQAVPFEASESALKP